MINEVTSVCIRQTDRQALVYRVLVNKYTGWFKKVSVHLTITVQYNPHTTDDLKMAITEYIRNVDHAILNTVSENTVRRVNKCLETGGGTLWTLLVTFCIVNIGCTETFWSTCITNAFIIKHRHKFKRVSVFQSVL